MAFYGWPVSQCQQKRLDTQLHAGIRVIDIRLSVVDGRLIAYHGIFPEVTPFAEMLATLHHFLTFPNTASETVVVSIKQEDRDTGSFPKLVYEEIVASPGGREMWFVENRIPNLGEVRGKAVMFSRFGGDDANGIHPSVWPDSVKEGFQWECDRTLVRTQDWCVGVSNSATFVAHVEVKQVWGPVFFRDTREGGAVYRHLGPAPRFGGSDAFDLFHVGCVCTLCIASRDRPWVWVARVGSWVRGRERRGGKVVVGPIELTGVLADEGMGTDGLL